MHLCCPDAPYFINVRNDVRFVKVHPLVFPKEAISLKLAYDFIIKDNNNNHNNNLFVTRLIQSKIRVLRHTYKT